MAEKKKPFGYVVPLREPICTGFPPPSKILACTGVESMSALTAQSSI